MIVGRSGMGRSRLISGISGVHYIIEAVDRVALEECVTITKEMPRSFPRPGKRQRIAKKRRK